MQRQLNRSRNLLATLCVAGTLAGCQGIYLHNSDRAAVAASSKTNVDSVDVASISKTEQANLDKLLQSELQSIDDRGKLAATLAVIELSASDESIADHYAHAIQKMQLWLHTDSMRALSDGTNCTVRKQAAQTSIVTKQSTLEAFGATNVPKCATAMPTKLDPPADLTTDEKTEFASHYGAYVEMCKTLLATCSASADSRALDDAVRKRDDNANTANRDKEALDKARAEYEAAVNGNQQRAEGAAATEEKIRAAATKLSDALDKLSKSSPLVADRLKASALVDLLGAAAGGKTASTDPALAPALEIAKSAPGLAESIAVARAQTAAVPTSHLLLALNNLTIQAERDARLAALDNEEIAILERKVASLDRQARLWRQYSDQLCNLVYLGAKKDYPGAACDTLAIVQTGNTRRCTLRVMATPQQPDTVVENCILAKSWRDLFGDTSLDSRQRRALYEAAAAYLQVRLVAYDGVGDDFRRIAVAHRRTVAERETALEQWKNVVSVPADALDGYYKGGVKPAELADLIVKALGFTAIAIGVAR